MTRRSLADSIKRDYTSGVPPVIICRKYGLDQAVILDLILYLSIGLLNQVRKGLFVNRMPKPRTRNNRCFRTNTNLIIVTSDGLCLRAA